MSCTKKMSKEVTPFYIKISGPMADRKQEISGMDWYKDNLFLLPENFNGYVFLIKKAEIDSRINKTDTSTITPKKIKFNRTVQLVCICSLKFVDLAYFVDSSIRW